MGRRVGAGVWDGADGKEGARIHDAGRAALHGSLRAGCSWLFPIIRGCCGLFEARRERVSVFPALFRDLAPFKEKFAARLPRAIPGGACDGQGRGCWGCCGPVLVVHMLPTSRSESFLLPFGARRSGTCPSVCCWLSLLGMFVWGDE